MRVSPPASRRPRDHHWLRGSRRLGRHSPQVSSSINRSIGRARTLLVRAALHWRRTDEAGARALPLAVLTRAAGQAPRRAKCQLSIPSPIPI